MGGQGAKRDKILPCIHRYPEIDRIQRVCLLACRKKCNQSLIKMSISLLFKVVVLSITLFIMVMVSWVQGYVKSHQTEYTEYVQFFYIDYTLIKPLQIGISFNYECRHTLWQNQQYLWYINIRSHMFSYNLIIWQNMWYF